MKLFLLFPVMLLLMSINPGDSTKVTQQKKVEIAKNLNSALDAKIKALEARKQNKKNQKKLLTKNEVK
jgi:hypothetical protein